MLGAERRQSEAALPRAAVSDTAGYYEGYDNEGTRNVSRETTGFPLIDQMFEEEMRDLERGSRTDILSGSELRRSAEITHVSMLVEKMVEQNSPRASGRDSITSIDEDLETIRESSVGIEDEDEARNEITEFKPTRIEQPEEASRIDASTQSIESSTKKTIVASNNRLSARISNQGRTGSGRKLDDGKAGSGCKLSVDEEHKEDDLGQNVSRGGSLAGRIDRVSSVAIAGEPDPRNRPDIITEEMPTPAVEEKVKDSDKYAVFFKMLRMGVPMPAVKHKMTQKGFNPNILDLGEEGLMTKVLALERAYDADQKQQKAPKTKGETIYWEAIPESQLMSRETIFVGSDFELEQSTLENVKDLLELFKRPPQDPDAPDGGDKHTVKQSVMSYLRKERVDSVLDPRRAQAVSIAMRKLHIMPDQPAKFTWALREMNENVLNAAALEVLMSCPLWPINEEEHNSLKSKADSGAKLAEPDKLILFVGETVPDVATRINAMAFRWEFETSIMDAVKAAGDVKIASKSILAHNNLKVIIRATILVGNAINEESGTKIKGCTLGSMIKLATTKAIRDKSQSVLDCVAAYCMRCYPDFSSVVDLVPFVVAAKKIELEAQIKSIRDMRRGVEAIRKMRQLEVFAFDAMRRLDIVESEMGVARDFYDELLKFFGIPVGEMEASIFFELLFQFFEQWNKAIAKKQKEIKTQAAAVLAAAAAKKAADRAAVRAAEKAEREKQKQDETEASKGLLRLPVQLKGLFQRRPGPLDRIQGGGSQTDMFISGSPESPRRTLTATPKGERKARKSIFFGGGVRDSQEAGVMRPKGRKSIFWG